MSLNLRKLSIEFCENFSLDIERIFELLSKSDPSNYLNRAKQMGMSDELANEIHENKNYDYMKTKIEEFARPIYNEKHELVINSIQTSQIEWNEFVDEFSEALITIIQHPLRYYKYYCAVSPINAGVSDWAGNRIIIKYDYVGDEKNRFIAHEVILSLVFQLIREYFVQDVLSDWKLWAISEISTIIVLGNDKMKPFWKTFVPSECYFEKSNYPQLSELEEKFKEFYNVSVKNLAH